MTRDELRLAAEKIAAAKSPADVFGKAATQAEARVEYLRLAQMLHPDRHGGDPAATEALTALNVLYGRVGAPADPPPAPRSPVVVQVGKRRYVVGDLHARGDVGDLYLVEGAGEPALLKVAHTPAENDLIDAEVAALRKLGGCKFDHYFPHLIDSFAIRGSAGRRQALVVPLYSGHVTTTLALASYPLGLDYRDVAWMFKRLLVALGQAHRLGLAHGAVLPGHVLVHPKEHGIKLVGWTHSVPLGKPLRSISAGSRAFYAPELLDKRPASAASDLYMAAATAVSLMSGGNPDPRALGVDVPPPVAKFFRGCVDSRPGVRPPDAWDLHAEYDQVLFALNGKPRYRELVLR